MATLREGLIEHIPTESEPEIMVNGEPWAPTVKRCHHDHELFGQEVVVATLKDDDGNVAGWEVRLRIKCTECGEDFVFDNPEGRLRDKGTAIVLDIKPGDFTDAG